MYTLCIIYLMYIYRYCIYIGYTLYNFIYTYHYNVYHILIHTYSYTYQLFYAMTLDSRNVLLRPSNVWRRFKNTAVGRESMKAMIHQVIYYTMLCIMSSIYTYVCVVYPYMFSYIHTVHIHTMHTIDLLPRVSPT